MRFSGPVDQEKKAAMGEDGTAFFITEDIRDDGLFPIDGVEQIQEEKSYGSEAVQDQEEQPQPEEAE